MGGGGDSVPSFPTLEQQTLRRLAPGKGGRARIPRVDGNQQALPPPI